MAFTVQTLIPQSVLYQTVSGHYSIDDITSAVVDIVKFLDTCGAGEGIMLANLAQLKSIPTNLLDVRKATEAFFRHPNYKVTVAYGSTTNVVLSFLVNSLAGMFKQPIKLFGSEAEAVNFIIAQRPNLAESLPRALGQAKNATS